MAHFAELDNTGTVLQIIVVSDADAVDGEKWCRKLLGGTWKQTSYNGNFRLNYASIGGRYIQGENVFISASPYRSWSLDNDYKWQPPTLQPKDGKRYKWNENNKNWVSDPHSGNLS